MIRPTILATTITAILVHNTVSANTTNQTLIQTQDARNQALLEQLVPNPRVVAVLLALAWMMLIQLPLI